MENVYNTFPLPLQDLRGPWFETWTPHTYSAYLWDSTPTLATSSKSNKNTHSAVILDTAHLEANIILIQNISS